MHTGRGGPRAAMAPAGHAESVSWEEKMSNAPHPPVVQDAIIGKSHWPSFISVAVIKHPDEKQLREDRVYFSLHLQVVVHHSREEQMARDLKQLVGHSCSQGQRQCMLVLSLLSPQSRVWSQGWCCWL